MLPAPTCLISVRLGEALGLRDHELRDVYYLVLLAYVGCAADAHETAKLLSFTRAAEVTPGVSPGGQGILGAQGPSGFIARRASQYR